jgi:putative Mg2+ transporter-C (MgtC) family protein
MWNDLVMRLGVALLLGALIGLERQWRSRYVGLRTNTLLTIGSAAMMYFGLAISKNDPLNTVHVVAAIITGIGFLGAGIIIQEGVTVRGCSTAATFWCSVAVGLFAGARHFMEAAILTVFIALANPSLRPIVHYINKKTSASSERSGQKVAAE